MYILLMVLIAFTIFNFYALLTSKKRRAKSAASYYQEMGTIEDRLLRMMKERALNFTTVKRLMNDKGVTVFLSAPVERIAARLSLPGAKAKRPIIAGKSNGELTQFIRENLKAREPYYSQATITFDSTDIETAAATEATAAILIKKLSSINAI